MKIVLKSLILGLIAPFAFRDLNAMTPKQICRDAVRILSFGAIDIGQTPVYDHSEVSQLPRFYNVYFPYNTGANSASRLPGEFQRSHPNTLIWKVLQSDGLQRLQSILLSIAKSVLAEYRVDTEYNEHFIVQKIASAILSLKKGTLEDSIPVLDFSHLNHAPRTKPSLFIQKGRKHFQIRLFQTESLSEELIERISKADSELTATRQGYQWSDGLSNASALDITPDELLVLLMKKTLMSLNQDLSPDDEQKMKTRIQDQIKDAAMLELFETHILTTIPSYDQARITLERLIKKQWMIHLSHGRKVRNLRELEELIHETPIQFKDWISLGLAKNQFLQAAKKLQKEKFRLESNTRIKVSIIIDDNRELSLSGTIKLEGVFQKGDFAIEFCDWQTSSWSDEYHTRITLVIDRLFGDAQPMDRALAKFLAGKLSRRLVQEE